MKVDHQIFYVAKALSLQMLDATTKVIRRNLKVLVVKTFFMKESFICGRHFSFMINNFGRIP